MNRKLESNEQQMRQIAKEIVTEMNLSKQINEEGNSMYILEKQEEFNKI